MNLANVRTKSADVLIVRVVDMSLPISGMCVGRFASGDPVRFASGDPNRVAALCSV